MVPCHHYQLQKVDDNAALYSIMSLIFILNNNNDDDSNNTYNCINEKPQCYIRTKKKDMITAG